MQTGNGIAVPCFSVSKKGVIASQCAHWRGNPLDFQTFTVDIWAFIAIIRGSPHQSEDWFAMTCVILGFFDSLNGRALARPFLLSVTHFPLLHKLS